MSSALIPVFSVSVHGIAAHPMVLKRQHQSTHSPPCLSPTESVTQSQGSCVRSDCVRSDSFLSIPMSLPLVPHGLSPQPLSHPGLLIFTATLSLVYPPLQLLSWEANQAGHAPEPLQIEGNGRSSVARKWPSTGWPSVPLLLYPQLSQKPFPLHGERLNIPDWNSFFYLSVKEAQMASFCFLFFHC